MIILNYNVKYRIEKDRIFICDCKRLIDLKIPIKYYDTLEHLRKGEQFEDTKENRTLVMELVELGMTSNLNIRSLKTIEFDEAFTIMNENLKLFRTKEFLKKKMSHLFIGAFIDCKMVGVIFGFPRDGALLLSEIAVIPALRDRNIGKQLVEAFEIVARRKGHKMIKLGSLDECLRFYIKLDYSSMVYVSDGKQSVEIKIPLFNELYLANLRKDNPDKNIQALFYKELK